MRSHTFLLLLSSALAAQAGPQATFQSIDINTNNNPRGYWEFLPAEYHVQTEQRFPLVIFFHGLGEGGNGSTDLHEVLLHGPPKLVNDNVQSNVFVNNQAIMLAPQVTNNTWWNDNHIRPFLDYALSHYRVDELRIYFTGLSAGSSGINDFMDDDPQAHQITATTVAAVRGVVSLEGGGYLSAMVPYWGLTARGDASNTLINSVNNLAGFLNGNTPTDVMATYPNQDINRTAVYDQHNTQAWTWYDGIDSRTDVNPKITLYPGSSHFTWAATYNNNDVWDWLFAQVKPTLEVQSPVANQLYVASQPIDFTAHSMTSNGQPITDISWSSSLDGYLGAGNDVQFSLSVGIHELEVMAVDDGYRGQLQSLTIEVVETLGDEIFVDGFEGIN